jgi:hypothetical protein
MPFDAICQIINNNFLTTTSFMTVPVFEKADILALHDLASEVASLDVFPVALSLLITQYAFGGSLVVQLDVSNLCCFSTLTHSYKPKVIKLPDPILDEIVDREKLWAQ